jgi:hypothetical protein
LLTLHLEASTCVTVSAVRPEVQTIFRDIEALVGAWCDRRALRALREILAGWPIVGGLTDDWGHLSTALERVRAFARADVTEEEMEKVEELIRGVQRIVDRR